MSESTEDGRRSDGRTPLCDNVACFRFAATDAAFERSSQQRSVDSRLESFVRESLGLASIHGMLLSTLREIP